MSRNKKRGLQYKDDDLIRIQKSTAADQMPGLLPIQSNMKQSMHEPKINQLIISRTGYTTDENSGYYDYQQY